jgi:RND family efflux transporter MFP subunit
MGIEIEAVGTTQANESVEITSKASNTVTAIRFQEGEVVERGSVLVEMDSSQVRANLAEAQAALARSKSQFDRSRDLQSRQAMAVADLEQVEAALKADEARVAAAQSRLDDTVIRASFSGRTGFRHVSVGSYVSAGTMITTLDADTACTMLRAPVMYMTPFATSGVATRPLSSGRSRYHATPSVATFVALIAVSGLKRCSLCVRP